MKLKISFLILSAFVFISCTSSNVITPAKFNKITAKSVSEWTYQDCEDVITKYTSYNKKGYADKYINVNSNGEKVYITAYPLNENVIQAKVRREAIVRRYSEENYKNRLKEELEYYTNKTVNMNDGGIILKEGPERFQNDKLSFEVVFENISEPREPIEIEYASDGFFLENANGDFTRAVDMSGYYVEDYFVLIDKLKAVITFSVYDDKGKNIFYGDNINKGYRLVFNGFQPEPVLVEWAN